MQSGQTAAGFNPVVKIFWIYAHKDKKHRDHLERHLWSLKRRGYIKMWPDREILPGSPWDQEIHGHLDTADLFLPLVSVDFLNSEYCQGVEMRRALERLNREEVAIVPILVRPADCQGSPIYDLQMLPTGGKPITRWSIPDLAYINVAAGIGKVVDRLRAPKLKLQGDAWCNQQAYDQALAAYDEALRLDPENPCFENPYFHCDRGKALYHLQRFEEAKTAYEKAIALKPDYGPAYQGRGDACLALGKQVWAEYQQLAKKDYQLADELDAKQIGKHDLAPQEGRRKQL